MPSWESLRAPKEGEWLVVHAESGAMRTRVMPFPSEDLARRFVTAQMPNARVTFGPYIWRGTSPEGIVESFVKTFGERDPAWAIWRLPTEDEKPNPDLQPDRQKAFKAALRRAGVSEETLRKLPKERIAARGGLLRDAEKMEHAARDRFLHAAKVLEEHGFEVTAIGAVAGELATARAYLMGLRTGIEFATHVEE